MRTVKLHNTLGRRLSELAPLEPGHVRIYTCGPTVYNVVHIGNLRTFVFEDILRRHRSGQPASGMSNAVPLPRA